MFLPISTSTSFRRVPRANYALIAANVLVFFILGGVDRPTSFGKDLLGQLALSGDSLQVYQFFTYQFLHGGFGHIGGNMLFLWVFGNSVNAKMGDGPYLLFYLAGGVFAATGYAWLNADFTLMVGASGAVAAVTTAYLALFPRSRITILYWWFFIGTFELPSMIMIVFKMILWDNVLADQFAGASNVAFDAHMSGYAFGLAATAALLALRFLPRDQFDIVALWRRWLQRQGMRAAMADPQARAQAQYGRVARPVSIDGVTVRTVSTPQDDRITQLRTKIAEALGQNDRDTAAAGYEELMEIDPQQVLSRTAQLEVANQLCTLGRLPQAAAAYEKYLTQYSPSREADEVELLLGIIYARDLQQYELADAHLRLVLERVANDTRRDQCRHWLEVAAQALGRPSPEP